MIFILILMLAATQLRASNFMVRSHPYDLILWRYYNNHPPALLVNIQVETDLAHQEINYSIFQDWQTLHFADSTHHEQAINSQSPTIFRYNFNQTSSNKSNALSLNLDELCERYFTEKPAFMAISHGKIDDLLDHSPFWTKSHCIPKLLLLKFSQYSSKMLEENKWALIERAGNYAIYLDHQSQAEYNERWSNSTKTEQTLPTLEWNSTISSIEKFITSNNKIAEGANKQAIKIYNTKQKIISISDNLDELAVDSSENSHIVMKYYNADYNVVITGKNSTHTTYNVNNFILENVTIAQRKISFLFPRLPSQRFSLIDGDSNESKCVNPYDVEEQVFVKIRGNVGNRPEQLVAQSFIELKKVKQPTQPTSTDVTHKPTPPTPVQIQDKLTKPENLLNQKPKVDNKPPLPPTTQIKQDKLILIAMVSILVLTLAIFAIRQIYIKWRLRSRMKILTKIQQIKQTFEEISITQSQSKLEEESTI